MIVEKVVVGKLGVNCYILHNLGERRGVLIDCGADAIAIEQRAKSAGIENITAVLLTHAHFDHVGAVSYFQKKGAEVYLHAADVNYDNSFSYSLWGIESRDDYRVDNVLYGGEILDINDIKFEVIHTPGHSKGSVCYKTDSAIFCGDTLFFQSYGRTDLSGGDFRELCSSIDLLFGLRGNYRLYCGHGEDTDLDAERNNNPILIDKEIYGF